MRRLALIFALLTLLCGCASPVIPQQNRYSPPESLYAPGDFAEADGFLTCTKGGAVNGIDVSSHQGQIDWDAVASAGVQFAFVRLGYRGYSSGTLHTDEFARQNLEGAKAAGLKVGAYFFSQAVSEAEAVEEAEYALEVLAQFVPDLPLMYDWEYVSEDARTGHVDGSTLTACTAAFCGKLRQAGQKPGVYFNTSQALKLDLQQLEDNPWWLAKYDEKMDFICQTDLWQYSNTGSVPGIRGNVDLDLMFTDYGLGADIFGQE